MTLLSINPSSTPKKWPKQVSLYRLTATKTGSLSPNCLG